MSVSELVRHYRKSLLARVNLLGSFHDRHLLYEAALSGRNLVLMCSRCVPFAEGPSLGTTVAKAKVRSRPSLYEEEILLFRKSGLIFGPENQNFQSDFPFPRHSAREILVGSVVCIRGNKREGTHTRNPPGSGNGKSQSDRGQVIGWKLLIGQLAP